MQTVFEVIIVCGGWFRDRAQVSCAFRKHLILGEEKFYAFS